MSRAILMIARKSLRQHLFSTAITVISVALASGLIMAVFAIESQSRQAFANPDVGYDAVLGARGSKLQLVLNTVFHLETSPGNIPWTLYTSLRDNTVGVQKAIPVATGDNYLGFRIVGTTHAFFTDLPSRSGAVNAVRDGGRFFDDGFREAVVGSFVAEQTGLRPGDTINPYHGLTYDENAKHPEEYTVVGILEPTNTPSDRVIWIPIEGIFRMEGHVLRASGEDYQAAAGQSIPDEHKEVSAVLLKLASPATGWQLEQTINKQGKVATLAFPLDAVMLDLFEKMGWVNRVLKLVAYLVVLVSATAITASIYNTINERRREFAILRALGARRATVFGAIVLESSLIGFIGAIAGFALYMVILAVAAWVVREHTGVVLRTLVPHPIQVITPLGMTLVGGFAGIIPAVRAYGTDIATNLLPKT
ncbi:MAG: ABC transporter permease [Candidatus Hydrogenedentes bacterium]|nr:ABC transporter permease [Candidatus Hydrogenedentota bacterium]